LQRSYSNLFTSPVHIFETSACGENVKFSLCLITTPWGSGGIAPLFLTSALDGGEWSASCPGRFTRREIAPSIHWIGGWVGSGVGLDVEEHKKISFPFWESNLSHPSRSPPLYRLSYLGSLLWWVELFLALIN
jgi:hypothetical protein